MSEFVRNPSRLDQDQEAMSEGRNELSGTVYGPTVQARSIYGDIQFYVDSSAKMPVPNQLAAAPANFTGRNTELARLHRIVAEQETANQNVLIVMTGVGGVGKTSLALRLLEELRDRYPAGQLFADLSAFAPDGPRGPGAVLDWFLRSLGVPPERIPVELGERAGLFRSLTTGRAMALLLDDAATAAQVRAVLPATGPSVVVVTTRRLIAGLAVDGARFVELSPLDEDAAIELLDRIAGSGRTRADPHGARRLVRLCGRLPIAVCASGARLAPHPRWEIRRIVDELVDERQRLAALSRTVDLSVAAVFDVSYRALSGHAARMYRLLGLWPGADFGAGLGAALAAVDPDEASDLLDALAEASLLDEIADRRFRFHDLVRLHAREQAEAEPENERLKAVARGIDWYLRAAVTADRIVLPARWRIGPYYRTPPEPPVRLVGSAAAISWLESELGNILSALRYAADRAMNQSAWQICEALWGLFLFRKHYDAWVESHQIGLACAQACRDRRATARMHNQLGSAYRSLRRYDEAVDHFHSALELERAIGHRLGEGSALDQLGVVHLRLGHYDRAVDHFAQARAIYKEVGEVRGVALMDLYIGNALSDTGRYDEAVDYLRAAYRQAGSIPDAYQQARALSLLGQAQLRAGRTERAAEPLGRALTFLEGLQATHDQAIVHTYMADLGEQIGDLAAARTHLERALGLFMDVNAPHVEDVRARLEALARGPDGRPTEPDRPDR